MAPLNARDPRRLQDETAVAIGTFDEILVAHFQIDPRWPERAADAVAGDAAGLNFDDFGGFYGHGWSPDGWRFLGGGGS